MNNKNKTDKKAVAAGSISLKPEWRIIVEMLEKIDPVTLNRILRRMIYYLFKKNVQEITDLLKILEPAYSTGDAGGSLYSNVPNPKLDINSLRKFTQMVFQVAGEHIDDNEITRQMHFWMAQERSRFLAIAAENINISLMEISGAINRFMNIPRGESFLSPDEFVNIRVALIRRFLSNDLKYINVAKHYIKVIDFSDILKNTIGPGRGSGKLGGKSAGLILASKIIAAEKPNNPNLENIRVPRSWYITSDTIMEFIHYNALEEIISLKYMETDGIRAGYSYLQQLFKHAFFPPEITVQLNALLAEIGDRPIIVRSSSLLEDSFNAAFSGKYKSLFLSNTGPKEERLSNLQDAMAEIFASTFGPDPIEYRKERGLLDFQEEMGILIQEVVGNRMGKYFAPSYAGVAFSRNEFRWSSRIALNDGMVRVVAGLGTRAVDRIGDDYTFLGSPGKPGLKVNLKYEDLVKYSQSKIDVLNLESNQFETLEAEKFLSHHQNEYRGIEKIVSLDRYGHLSAPVGTLLGHEQDDMVITFQNLTDSTPFLKQIDALLKVLEKALQTPVDIEFASDGDNLFLLQCRPQSHSIQQARVTVPDDIDSSRLIFQANKYISSGHLPAFKYLVFVDPDAYNHLDSIEKMKKTAAMVSKLNHLIGKRDFILIGPGRWGSRGDIRLGVQVSYSDINNSAMLVELAYQKNGYVPELSFGTHFFQDLVESDIKYLPIYPNESGNFFNRDMLLNSRNRLLDYFPSEKEMAEVIHIICSDDLIKDSSFSVVMDSEKGKAVGFLA